MIDVLAVQHLGHAALDLAALGLALTTFTMAILVAVALDRRTDRASTPSTTKQERTDP